MSKKEISIALLFYLGLSLLVTFPLLFHFLDHVTGAEQSDLWAHIWGFWRTERSLITMHQLPYQVHFLNYPVGGVLYHVDLLNSMFMIPLKMIFGMVVGYNLLVLIQLVLGGFCMHLVARQFTKRTIPALLAGMSYAFCSFVITFPLASGVSERLNIAWIPLFFFFLLKILKKPRIRYFILAGITYGFAALGCWKYGLFVYFLTFLFALFLIFRLPIKKLIDRKGNPGLISSYLRLLFTRLLPLALVCGLVVVPILLPATSSVQASSGLLHRESNLFWNGKSFLNEMNMFDLRDLFLPQSSSLRVTYHWDLLYQGAYIGFLLMLLSLFSIPSRKTYSLFFVPAALLFLILTLGPTITLSPSSLRYDSLVYQFMARTVPFFTSLHAPWEYILLCAFCLSAAAAIGLDFIITQLPGKLQIPFAAAVLVLVGIEQFWVNPVPVPVPIAPVKVPEFYYTLAQDKDDYAVFEFPDYRDRTNLVYEMYFYYQTIHQKLIPYGINRGWTDEDPFWRSLRHYQRGISGTVLDVDPSLARASIKYLREHNYRYFIVHKYLLVKEKQAVFRSLFDELFGEPYYESEDLVVYQI